VAIRQATRGITRQGPRPVFSSIPLAQHGDRWVFANPAAWRSSVRKHAAFASPTAAKQRSGALAASAEDPRDEQPSASGQPGKAGGVFLSALPHALAHPCPQSHRALSSQRNRQRGAKGASAENSNASCFSLLFCHCPAWRAWPCGPAAKRVGPDKGQISRGRASWLFVQSRQRRSMAAFPYHNDSGGA